MNDIDATDLVVLSESVDPPLGHSVGRWLYDAQARWSAEHAGAFVDRPAASETVQGATGGRPTRRTGWVPTGSRPTTVVSS